MSKLSVKRQTNKLIFFILAISIVVGLSAFLFSLQKSMTIISHKPQVVTSFFPLQFFTSQIAGDKADVISITPNGVEPHDYEPTTQDLRQIENADLIVVIGENFEPWASKIDGLEVSEGLTQNNDPHIWLDPILSKQVVNKILMGLVQIDPKNKSYYDTNAKNLESRLDQLNNDFTLGLKNCIRHDFVTSHEAFGYFASRYNLNQVAISGLSPDEEASPRDIARIADFAKQNNIKYIFFEELVSPKLAETVANEIGAQTLVLDPIESGEDYFLSQQENLKNIKIALGCQ